MARTSIKKDSVKSINYLNSIVPSILSLEPGSRPFEPQHRILRVETLPRDTSTCLETKSLVQKTKK